MSNRRKLKRTPGALAREDQARAASRQVARGLLVTAALAGLDVSGEPSGPIGQRLADWRQAELEHKIIPACPHLANPRPLGGLLCDPGRVYCTTCAVVEAGHRMVLAPDQCDTCGQTSRIFHEVMLGGEAPLMLLGNVCPDCCTAALR